MTARFLPLFNLIQSHLGDNNNDPQQIPPRACKDDNHCQNSNDNKIVENLFLVVVLSKKEF